MKSYGGRDQATGLYYEKLLNAGAVDEEFQLFGCMYLEHGEPGFFVTEKEKKFFEFQLDCEQKGIYCTPPMLETYWAKVAKGERQKLKKQFQFDLIEKLERQYHSSFFENIKRISEIPSSDAAEIVFSTWKSELDSCYDLDLLHLYEATVAMALQMKLLTPYSGMKYLNWVKQLKKQLMEDELRQDGELHTYAGLAYMDSGDETIRYIQYGKHYTAWKKRQQLMLEGKLVSPVLIKNLYYAATDFSIIQEKRKHFEQCMKEIMNAKYFEYLKELYALPKIVSKEFYNPMAQEMNTTGTVEEQTAFQLYCARLRLQ